MDNVYQLYSGNMIGIEKVGFEERLKCVIVNIGKILTQNNNLITRNLKNVDKSKFINEVVSHSIKTICYYKNEQFINELIAKITKTIFGEHSNKLTMDQFMEKIDSMMENSAKSSSSAATLHIIWLSIDLFRVETLMVNDSVLKTNILKQSEGNSSNFYSQ
jgi:hypothetical protein